MGVDHLGPFKVTNSGNQHLIVLNDYLSRYLDVEAVPSTDSDSVVNPNSSTEGSVHKDLIFFVFCSIIWTSTDFHQEVVPLDSVVTEMITAEPVERRKAERLAEYQAVTHPFDSTQNQF